MILHQDEHDEEDGKCEERKIRELSETAGIVYGGEYRNNDYSGDATHGMPTPHHPDEPILRGVSNGMSSSRTSRTRLDPAEMPTAKANDYPSQLLLLPGA